MGGPLSWGFGGGLITPHHKKLACMKCYAGCRLDSSGSGYRPVMGSCEHSNEPSGSIKCREFLD